MFPWLRDSWQKLLAIYSGDRAPHSVLLYGKDGLGKKEIARELAKFYLCHNKNINGYCGVCPSCQSFDSSTHGDFLVISTESGSVIGIDEIRSMIELMSQTSRLEHGRVVIIENIEFLSVAAANSLLKILEEPSSDLIFILTADSLLNIIPTILSRCVKFEIKDPDYQQTSGWMRQQLSDKNADLHHMFLVNNCSPLDTVRFINAGQHHLVYKLVASLGEFIQDLSRTGPVLDILQEISDTSPAKHEEEDKKSKTKKIEFDLVYPWLYYIVADMYRINVTGSVSKNYFIRTKEMALPFCNMPLYVLHEAVEELCELSKNNSMLPTSYIGLHLINWMNRLARK